MTSRYEYEGEATAMFLQDAAVYYSRNVRTSRREESLTAFLLWLRALPASYCMVTLTRRDVKDAAQPKRVTIYVRVARSSSKKGSWAVLEISKERPA